MVRKQLAAESRRNKPLFFPVHGIQRNNDRAQLPSSVHCNEKLRDILQVQDDAISSPKPHAPERSGKAVGPLIDFSVRIGWSK